jgi:hypothetical protein
MPAAIRPRVSKLLTDFLTDFSGPDMPAGTLGAALYNLGAY